MYELIKVAKRTYYIDCPTKIGVYIDGENDAYFIDGGSDKDAGRRARQILEREGWRLRAIINTHSHADHVGGNAYLQQQTGCKIYAMGAESAIVRHTVLEPSMLVGAFPHSQLKHKFLMAASSNCEDLTTAQNVLPRGMEIFSLPGHFFQMIGVRTPDNIAFVADCVNSAAMLEKYKIGFLYDIGAQLETLEGLLLMKAKFFIPSHAEPTEDLTALVRLNIKSIHETRELILSLLETPSCFDEIMRGVFDACGLRMNLIQHALVGSTLRSYLAWLKDMGEVDIEICDNMLLWKKGSGN